MIDRLVAAHVFLTRLPMPRLPAWDDVLLARAAPFFPIVGLTVGGAAGLGRWAADPFGPFLASLVAVAVAVVVTGALHEDGLADTADAMGVRNRARRLHVLRDPRTGTFGVLAVVLVLLGRIALLASLDLQDAVLALLAAHALARWSVLPVAVLVPPARPDGSGRMLASLQWPAVAAGTLIVVAISAPALAVISPWALSALALCSAVVAVSAAGWRRAFGGVTGDTLGATAQLVELTCYACVAVAIT